ncbi:MAG: hypothetical protein AAFP99_03310 [Pseudomonadota bacterium]
MIRLTVWVLAISMALMGVARAEGFAITDLTDLNDIPQTLNGKSYSNRLAAKRLTLACDDCDGLNAVDVLIGRSTDGTEGRFRSGETTLKRMEDVCRSRDDTCRLERLDVGPSVGWLSIYARGSTAILFRDGDTLTIRGLAETPEVARETVRGVLATLAPTIVGN